MKREYKIKIDGENVIAIKFLDLRRIVIDKTTLKIYTLSGFLTKLHKKNKRVMPIDQLYAYPERCEEIDIDNLAIYNGPLPIKNF